MPENEAQSSASATDERLNQSSAPDSGNNGEKKRPHIPVQANIRTDKTGDTIAGLVQDNRRNGAARTEGGTEFAQIPVEHVVDALASESISDGSIAADGSLTDKEAADLVDALGALQDNDGEPDSVAKFEDIAPSAQLEGAETVGMLGSGAFGTVVAMRLDADGGVKRLQDAVPAMRMAVAPKADVKEADAEAAEEFISQAIVDIIQDTRLVAVKTIDKEGLANADAEARVSDAEARQQFLHSIDLPSMPKLFGYAESRQAFELIMQFIPGRTIGELINSESTHNKMRLPARTGLSLAAQATRSMYFAHKNAEVILRDVKPDNLRVGDDGNVYLLDLGTVRRDAADATARTKDGAFLGSPDYMAPEQAAGANLSKISSSADVFAMGVTITQMLTGKLPYPSRATVAAAVMKRAMLDSEKTPPSIHIPRPPGDPRMTTLLSEVEEFLKNMVHSDQAKRPTSREVAEFFMEHSEFFDCVADDFLDAEKFGDPEFATLMKSDVQEVDYSTNFQESRFETLQAMIDAIEAGAGEVDAANGGVLSGYAAPEIAADDESSDAFTSLTRKQASAQTVIENDFDDTSATVDFEADDSSSSDSEESAPIPPSIPPSGNGKLASLAEVQTLPQVTQPEVEAIERRTRLKARPILVTATVVVLAIGAAVYALTNRDASQTEDPDNKAKETAPEIPPKEGDGNDTTNSSDGDDNRDPKEPDNGQETTGGTDSDTTGNNSEAPAIDPADMYRLEHKSGKLFATVFDVDGDNGRSNGLTTNFIGSEGYVCIVQPNGSIFIQDGEGNDVWKLGDDIKEGETLVRKHFQFVSLNQIKNNAVPDALNEHFTPGGIGPGQYLESQWNRLLMLTGIKK